MTDKEIIETLKETISKRNVLPSRRLWTKTETALNEEYKKTDKKYDEAIKAIKKGVESVTQTCSVKYKLKLDIVDYIIGGV